MQITGAFSECILNYALWPLLWACCWRQHIDTLNEMLALALYIVEFTRQKATFLGQVILLQPKGSCISGVWSFYQFLASSRKIDIQRAARYLREMLFSLMRLRPTTSGHKAFSQAWQMKSEIHQRVNASFSGNVEDGCLSHCLQTWAHGMILPCSLYCTNLDKFSSVSWIVCTVPFAVDPGKVSADLYSWV